MQIKLKYIYIAVFIYLITAYFSVGHLHPDEYYQILEFAAFKLNISSPNGLTWEFYQQIRPALQGFLIVYLYKFIAIFHAPNPFVVTFLSRVFSASLSLIVAIAFIVSFKDELKSTNKQRWFILLTLFSWLIVFNSVRYSSENISGKLFILSVSLLLYPRLASKGYIYLLIGILLGLSCWARFQCASMLIGLIMWMILIEKKRYFSEYMWLFTGIILAVILGVYIDYWFYGNLVFTPWNYFKANILDGKAATFGVQPWYTYLYIAALIPYGPLYLLSSIYFIFYRRKHVFTWIMLPFIAMHLMVGHKELRFLTPLLTFMPFIIVDFMQILKEKYNWELSVGLKKLNLIAWYFNCFVVLTVMFVPSAMQIRINQLLYKKYTNSTVLNYITEGGNILDFYKHPNLRGIQIGTPAQMSCRVGETCLLALTCGQDRYYKWNQGKLIFSDCPDWIFKIDFNHWLERTALYKIYQITP